MQCGSCLMNDEPEMRDIACCTIGARFEALERSPEVESATNYQQLPTIVMCVQQNISQAQYTKHKMSIYFNNCSSNKTTDRGHKTNWLYGHHSISFNSLLLNYHFAFHSRFLLVLMLQSQPTKTSEQKNANIDLNSMEWQDKVEQS